MVRILNGEMSARVAVEEAPYSIDRPYEYLIPPSMADRLRPGMRVLVPFARGNRRCEAFVLKVTPPTEGLKLKAVDALLDSEPVLDPGQVRLGLWMRERFFCTAYNALRAMLPAGLWHKVRHVYRLSDGITFDMARAQMARRPAALQALDVLESFGGGAELEQVKAEMGDEAALSALKRLRDEKIAVCETPATRKVQDKTGQTVILSIPAQEALDIARRKKKTAPAQAALLELMAELGEADVKELCYFTGAKKVSVTKLQSLGFVTLETREIFRRPQVQERGGSDAEILTGEQQAAFDGIRALTESGEAAVALLQGVTGSGKTAVYMALMEEMLRRGKDTIFLVPEIALTPQLVGRFTARFGDQVAVMHSALTMGERYDEWKRIRSGGARIVVGTRSAVFAPIQNLGAIIMDEEQEYTYKSEMTPRYHARDVAKYRCHQSGALLLLGSATPTVETMYSARQGVYHSFALQTRYNQMELPRVIVADMKKNLREGGDITISEVLREELEKNLETGEQSILFINRRGTSNLIACGECGHVPGCDRCSVSLTYHEDNHRLMCHYCGRSIGIMDRCPECGGFMKQIGAGTQKVEQQLLEMFPGVEVLRMDMDTISQKRTHEMILADFEGRRVPILVGTQMVTKGLDFENVTLVGVVSADQSLYVSDYRAQERTFALITQVVGRAGRGEKAGRAVIQTYTPRNEVIELAARQDYEGFYEREIELRRVMNYPPVRDLISIMAAGISETRVLACCAFIRRELQRRIGHTAEVLGPAPPAVARVNNRYRYKVTVSCKNDKITRGVLAAVIQRAAGMKEFRGVTVYGDLDSFE